MAGEFPEILLLPGFMGVHLVNGAGERVWLNPIAMLRGDLAARLALDNTGGRDAPAGEQIRPERLIEVIYAEAIQRWVDEGFVVHEFPFDFRRSLLDLGLSLRAYIEERARRAPDVRFVFVGHSMGALLATIYAYYDPAFEERIERTIFLGAPLAGTFDAVEAVTGTYWMLPRLARLTRNDSTRQFQDAIRSWPGLYSMLPDLTCFPATERLFSASAWPSGLEPRQKWLDEARALKEVIRRTPLYRKPTAQLLSLRYRTVADLIVGENNVVAAGPRIAKGDGTVVARTAIPPGVTGYHTDFPHSLMPLDPKVMKAVIELIRTGASTLAPIQPGDAEGEFEGDETPVGDMLKGIVGSLTGDIGQRLITTSIVSRLFSRV